VQSIEIASCRAFFLKTTAGLELGGAATARSHSDSLAFAEAGSIYRVEFRFCCSLNSAVYFMNAGLVGEVGGKEVYLYRLVDALAFRVLHDEQSLATGSINFNCNPSYHLLECEDEGLS